jgi:ATP-dependent DNA helicase RecQ
VNRPNIALARLHDVGADKRYLLIRSLLKNMPPGRAMLFVPSVRTGEQLREGLRSVGLDVPFFHSKLGTANERDMLLGRFTGRIEPASNVVICTNAFGMGLDLPNVRLVVHWQHPASLEDYLQEFGRAGRDGAPSVAILFTDAKDVRLLTFMADRTVEKADLDPVGKAQVRQAKYDAITQMRERAVARHRCFRADIVQYFGEQPSEQRKSWAVRIVEWLFSRSTQMVHAAGCCDKCDQVRVENVVSWAARIWGTHNARYEMFRGWLAKRS